MAPILASEVNPDGSVTVTYGRKDFSQGQLVIPAAMRGTGDLQSIVDLLYDHQEFQSTVVSRRQEAKRSNG